MRYLASLQLFLKNPAWDILIILFFLFGGFVWGTLAKGQARLLSFLFSTYLALFLTPFFLSFLDSYRVRSQDPYRNLLLFLSILILLFYLLNKKIFRALPRTPYRWWTALLMSFLAVGLFVSGILNMISGRGILTFSPITQNLFAGEIPYFFWVIAPIVGFLLFSRTTRP